MLAIWFELTQAGEIRESFAHDLKEAEFDKLVKAAKELSELNGDELMDAYDGEGEHAEAWETVEGWLRFDGDIGSDYNTIDDFSFRTYEATEIDPDTKEIFIR